ncbi:MAG: tetratricopeptide repeat protein [Anaerolineae bacterium]|nr:tetratricopeptide repeat protein [Gemmatimonadaceae bacterium]
MPEMLSHDRRSADDKLAGEPRQAKVSARPIPDAATLEFATRLASEGQRKYLERDFDDALQLLQKALEIRERAPNVASSGLIESLTSLAAVHVARGDLGRGELLLERALAGSEQLFGHQHLSLSPLLNNLAHVYYKRKKYEPAERLLSRLAGIMSNRGNSEPELAAVLASLATVREATGHIAAARQLWLRVLSIRETTLGADSPAVAAALEHLGELSAAAGHLEQAISLRGRALAIRERSLSPSDASLQVARGKIASLRAAVDARIARAKEPAGRPRTGFSDIEVTPAAGSLADRASPQTPRTVPVEAIFQAIAAAGDSSDGFAARISNRFRSFLSGQAAERARQQGALPEPGFLATASNVLSPSRAIERLKSDYDVLDEDDYVDGENAEGLDEDSFVTDGRDEESVVTGRFDLFSDQTWPKTKLIGGIVCLVALLAVAVSLIAGTDESSARVSSDLQSVEAGQIFTDENTGDNFESSAGVTEAGRNSSMEPGVKGGQPSPATRQRLLDSLARKRMDSLALPLRAGASQLRVPSVRAIVPQ